MVLASQVDDESEQSSSRSCFTPCCVGARRYACRVLIHPLPRDPVLSAMSVTEIADLLERAYDQGRPFSPKLIWELVHRALVAETDLQERDEASATDIGERPRGPMGGCGFDSTAASQDT